MWIAIIFALDCYAGDKITTSSSPAGIFEKRIGGTGSDMYPHVT